MPTTTAIRHGDEDFETGRLCRGDQFAILQFGPASLVCRLDPVCDEHLSQGRWRVLIEKNLQSDNFNGAAGSVFEHGPGLLRADARKPFDELVC